jgi:hypothetical protein
LPSHPRKSQITGSSYVGCLCVARVTDQLAAQAAYEAEIWIENADRGHGEFCKILLPSGFPQQILWGEGGRSRRMFLVKDRGSFAPCMGTLSLRSFVVRASSPSRQGIQRLIMVR